MWSAEPSPAQPVTPWPAATVILARDGDGGPEVFMVRRHGRSGFAASAWVFPGGTVDGADRMLDRRRWRGIDPPALAVRFRLPADEVLGMHVAAVRELFEEAGVLLAAHPGGATPDLGSPALLEERRRLASRGATAEDFAGFLDAEDLVLDLGALDYWSRWVTPAVEPRRYDTCFFLATFPEGQNPAHDAVETVQGEWVRPAAALADADFAVIFPTERTLRDLSGHRTVADARDSARAQVDVASWMPHVIVGDDGRYTGILHPDDPGHPAHPAHPRGAA